MFRQLNSRDRLRSVDGKQEKGKEKQTVNKEQAIRIGSFYIHTKMWERMANL